MLQTFIISKRVTYMEGMFSLILSELTTSAYMLYLCHLSPIFGSLFLNYFAYIPEKACASKEKLSALVLAYLFPTPLRLQQKHLSLGITSNHL